MPRINVLDEQGKVRSVRFRLIAKMPRDRSPVSTALEQRAGRVRRQVLQRPWDGQVLSALEREIALTIEQIDGCRHANEQVRRRLLRLECAIDTRLMGLALGVRPGYEPPESSEQRRLREQLLKIDEERRRLFLEEQVVLRPLQDRLLVLVNRHRLAAGE